MSLLSDLLEAAVSGVTKPTTSSTSDSTTNPEFATVFDAALSSTDTVGIDLLWERCRLIARPTTLIYSSKMALTQ